MRQTRAYRYRCYPNATQRVVLARTFGATRYVYNWALRLRTDAYYERQERLYYRETSLRLTKLKQEPDTAWLREIAAVPVQECLRHLDTAFRNFFDGRTAYPSFKRKHGHQSAQYTRSGFRYRNGKLTLAKMDTPLKIRWSRPLPKSAIPSTVTVSRDSAGRYFVSLLVTDDIHPLPKMDTAVGIDLGITSLVTLSTGEKIGNPRHLTSEAKRHRKAKKSLSRKQKGSKGREKARLRLARVEARIADRRKDFTHKLTTRLVRENQTICCESLRVKNMVRNHSLAKHISDAGWGELVRQLEYKAAWYGRTFVAIDRWYPSSKRCSHCGHVVPSLPLDIRQWNCPECGTRHDRDVNAAVNIAAAGLAVSAGGEAVRPGRRKSNRRASGKPESRAL
ncbi:MAG: transposase [Thermomicrobia bacterium]|nr:transposase [Thermomicrobia bacterium]MCA1722759.1 transposase [Thermomicrobia bacterium]